MAAGPGGPGGGRSGCWAGHLRVGQLDAVRRGLAGRPALRLLRRRERRGSGSTRPPPSGPTGSPTTSPPRGSRPRRTRCRTTRRSASRVATASTSPPGGCPPHAPDAAAVILVPGRGSCRHDPVLLLPAGMLHRNGFAVLLIDPRDRATRRSSTGATRGGTQEYPDVLGAWDWLRARGLPADRIGLLGESNGASTVVIAAGEEPGIAATWEDSGYSDTTDGDQRGGSLRGLSRDPHAGRLAVGPPLRDRPGRAPPDRRRRRRSASRPLDDRPRRLGRPRPAPPRPRLRPRPRGGHRQGRQLPASRGSSPAPSTSRRSSRPRGVRAAPRRRSSRTALGAPARRPEPRFGHPDPRGVGPAVARAPAVPRYAPRDPPPSRHGAPTDVVPAQPLRRRRARPGPRHPAARRRAHAGGRDGDGAQDRRPPRGAPARSRPAPGRGCLRRDPCGERRPRDHRRGGRRRRAGPRRADGHLRGRRR